MNQKITFRYILAIGAIILVLLPFAATFTSFLTSIFDRAGWYQPIEQYLVPFEAKLVAATVYPFGVQTRLSPQAASYAFYMLKNNTLIPVDLAWNCLGWQSMLLFIVSLFVGLRGAYTGISRMECIVFGFFGTLLVNIFRMSFIVVGIYYVNEVFAYVIHDYLTAFVTIIWLLFFWWFSYSYLLESKVPSLKNKQVPRVQSK